MIVLGVGDRDSVVALVKNRLDVWPVDDVFTHDLAARIRGYQARTGMEVTGLIEEELRIRLGV